MLAKQVKNSYMFYQKINNMNCNLVPMVLLRLNEKIINYSCNKSWKKSFDSKVIWKLV